MPHRRLPPLNAIRAFEAVARSGSYRLAAHELSVTPGALSQQVRKLEDDLGTKLLRREGRGVELTGEGGRLSGELSRAFAIVRESVATARGVEGARCIVVATDAPFAAKWLVPRLERFVHACPGIDLRIDAGAGLGVSEPPDVTIRLSTPEDPGAGDEELESAELPRESLVPLASPAYVELQRLREPRDLLRVPLLHDSVESDGGRPPWDRWFAAAGLDQGRATRSMDFGSHSEQALDAAIAGAGVVLGRQLLAAIDLEEGRLVAPFGPELETRTRYRCAYRSGAKRPRDLEAFRDWLEAEFA